ncbi:hypothetical protein H4R20_004752, partial [Coemansia guatemalensis]
MEFDGLLQSLRKELAACACLASADEIPWSWAATAVGNILLEHASGVSRTVLLTELEEQWHRVVSGQVLQADTHRTVEPFLARAVRLPPDSVFGLMINKIETIPGTKIWIWRVAGAPAPLDVAARDKEGRTRRGLVETQLEAFVHQRYYPLIEATEFDGFFSSKRTVLATGLRVADRGSGVGGHPVYTLLPTTSLAFELRIKDDPNLPEVLRAHTDEKLLKNIFGVHYHSGKFTKCAEPLFNADQLWCRIEYIGPVERVAHEGKQVDCLTIECVLEHEDPETAVNIVLWEDA